jgi:hypothetical protein
MGFLPMFMYSLALKSTTMNRHYTKVDFSGLALMVIVFEVLSALSLLFGGVGAIYMMSNFIYGTEAQLFEFIIISFGGISLAFIFFAIAEFLQLMLKIEVNTRKIEDLLSHFAPAEKKTITASKKTAVRKKTSKK